MIKADEQQIGLHVRSLVQGVLNDHGPAARQHAISAMREFREPRVVRLGGAFPSAQRLKAARALLLDSETKPTLAPFLWFSR